MDKIFRIFRHGFASQSIASTPSIDTLPDEVLLKIFSHFTWNELKQLSLVNHRWYRVAGTSSLVEDVFLNLYKCNSERDSSNILEMLIDSRILVGSRRQYSSILCRLPSKLDSLTKIGSKLTTCVNKWKITRLRVEGPYDLVVKFFQRYGELMTELVDLSVLVYRPSPENSNQDECNLELGRLRRFSWEQRWNNGEQLPKSLILVVPQLQYIKVEQNAFNNSLRLFDCTALKEMSVSSTEWLNSSFLDSESGTLLPLILQNLNCIELFHCNEESIKAIKSFATQLKVLSLSCLPEPMNFDLGLPHLCEIRLEDLHLLPSPKNTCIECPNLNKITVLDVKFATPIKFKAPRLHSLIVDQRALFLIELEDKHTLRNLGIRITYHDYHVYGTEFPVYPNITHLYLNMLEFCRNIPSVTIRETLLALGAHIEALTIIGINPGTLGDLVERLDKCPRLESLHLHRIPNLEFGTLHTENTNNFSLKKLLITNSTINAASQPFPINIEWVRFHRVQIEGIQPPPQETFQGWSKWYSRTRRAKVKDDKKAAEQKGIQASAIASSMLPGGEHLPLDWKEYLDIHGELEADYSTRGFAFDEEDEMLKWEPKCHKLNNIIYVGL